MKIRGVAMSKNFIFTSESVSEGHPDKLCDRISDSIVDLYLGKDPESRVAAETLATTDYVVIAGETRCSQEVTHAEIEEVARKAIKDIGYEQPEFHWQNLKMDIKLHSQSVDIAQGVDSGEDKEEGAGDQGIMFGYACRETDILMPAPIHYSHQILKSLAETRHSDNNSILGPDAKSQVSLEYIDGKPVRATSIVVSTQHVESANQDDIRDMVRNHVTDILPDGWMCSEDQFFVNPTGRFVIGGPDGDCGLTGRKIIVDTYGGAAPHGGGAFSGKDPTKVDRSAAYAARYLAKNIVASELADKCTIQFSYAIGVSEPISLFIDTHGTGKISDLEIANIIPKVMDLTPRGIREHLQLNKPIYTRTSSYGHFGRIPEADGGFSWEKTDLIDRIKAEVK